MIDIEKDRVSLLRLMDSRWLELGKKALADGFKWGQGCMMLNGKVCNELADTEGQIPDLSWPSTIGWLDAQCAEPRSPEPGWVTLVERMKDIRDRVHWLLRVERDDERKINDFLTECERAANCGWVRVEAVEPVYQMVYHNGRWRDEEVLNPAFAARFEAVDEVYVSILDIVLHMPDTDGNLAVGKSVRRR